MTKWIIGVIAALAIALGVAAPAQAYPTMPPGVQGPFTVTKVVDGDTIWVDNNGQRLKIRMIGLDIPETLDPREPVQCFGVEASAQAKTILGGQSVYLETDPSQDTVDRFGRTLAYVWTASGRLFNLDMITDGCAFEYTYDLPYRYQADFKAAVRFSAISEQAMVAMVRASGCPLTPGITSILWSCSPGHPPRSGLWRPWNDLTISARNRIRPGLRGDRPFQGWQSRRRGRTRFLYALCGLRTRGERFPSCTSRTAPSRFCGSTCWSAWSHRNPYMSCSSGYPGSQLLSFMGWWKWLQRGRSCVKTGLLAFFDTLGIGVGLGGQPVDIGIERVGRDERPATDLDEGQLSVRN